MPTNATPAQIRALQIVYKTLRVNGDPRTEMPSDKQKLPTGDWDDNDIRLLWTDLKTGRMPLDPDNTQRASWKGLTQAEAGYLLDYLNGKPTRLDASLDREFLRLDIIDQEAYFEAFCRPKNRHSKTLWQYGGRAFDELNFRDKYELLNTLKTRAPALGTPKGVPC